MGDISLEAFIDLEPPALVCFKARGRQVERVGVALAPAGVKQVVRQDRLAAARARDYTVTFVDDFRHFLAKPERYPGLAHVIGQRLPDLFIDEVKHLIALFDEGYVNAQRREDARVLHADYAGADNCQPLGELLEHVDTVGVDNRPSIERHHR